MNDALPMLSSPRSRTGVVLGCGLVVSLLVHFGAGATMIGYARSSWVQAPKGAPEVAMMHQNEEPDQIELGDEESSSASINWLGVRERPQEGDAEESVVDQAALSPDPGSSAVEQPPAQPNAQPAIDQPQTNGAPTQQETPTETTETPIEQQIRIDTPAAHTPSVPVDVPEVDPASDPDQVVPEQPEDPPEVNNDEIPPGPSLIAEPNEEPEPELDPASMPVELSDPEPSADPAEEQPTIPQSANDQPADQPAPPSGRPGELSKKQAVATAIRDATDIAYNRMNRPLVAHGLEIVTKEPRYPLSVRNNANPRNAIVLIRFNADGKVRSAEFLQSADKKRRFDTGRQDVDSPLLAAIYQWTAKGERIRELDPTDKDAFIEIPMRILFSRPKKEEADD